MVSGRAVAPGCQLEDSAGPVGAVVVGAVAAVVHPQEQSFHSAEIDGEQLRFIPAAHDVRVGELLAVGPDLEADAAFSVGVVIDADRGNELRGACL